MLLLLLVGLINLQGAHSQFQNCSQGGPPEDVFVHRGTVESPNFPSSYPNNAFCEWLVTLPDFTGRMDVRFSNFELEDCSNCGCDWLRLYDGDSSNSSLIGQYCRWTLPPAILASSNQLFVEFRTDSSIVYQGFQLAFENLETACNGTVRELTEAPGEIQTRHHPYFPYEPSMFCQWRIVAPAGQIVSGTFDQFVTEGCCDFLWIYDGRDNSAQLLGSYSGTRTGASFFTTQESAFLVFTTDGSVQHIGFRLSFEFLGEPVTEQPLTTSIMESTTSVEETSPPSVEATQQLTTAVIEGTTSVEATPPPSANKPLLEVNLNGTFRSDDQSPISDCTTAYRNELRSRASSMLTTVNTLIQLGDMCANSSQTSAVTFSVTLSALQQWGYTTLVMSLSASKEYSFDEVVYCGLEIRGYLAAHENWPQPVIRAPGGCPVVVWEPAAFQGNTGRWVCSSVE